MKPRTRTLAWLVVTGLLSTGTTNQPPMYCVEKTPVPRPTPTKGPPTKDIPIPDRDRPRTGRARLPEPVHPELPQDRAVPER